MAFWPRLQYISRAPNARRKSHISVRSIDFRDAATPLSEKKNGRFVMRVKAQYQSTACGPHTSRGICGELMAAYNTRRTIIQHRDTRSYDRPRPRGRLASSTATTSTPRSRGHAASRRQNRTALIARRPRLHMNVSPKQRHRPLPQLQLPGCLASHCCSVLLGNEQGAVERELDRKFASLLINWILATYIYHVQYRY